MVFIQQSKVFMSFYFLLYGNNVAFVFCQYQSDYFDLDNAISNDPNSYYHSKARQYENSNPDADIGATVIIDTNIHNKCYRLVVRMD